MTQSNVVDRGTKGAEPIWGNYKIPTTGSSIFQSAPLQTIDNSFYSTFAGFS